MAPSATTNGDYHRFPVEVEPQTLPNGDTRQRPLMYNPSPEDVNILEQLYGTKKQVRVVMLGAGMSGLNFFKVAEERLQNIDIVCYEKNADVGGTWYENRYPGCACDIPSVVYQFPWRPAPWTKYYSHSPEIWDYIKMVERENKFIDKYIKLQHKINNVSWSDETGQWTLNIQDLVTGREFKDHADLVIDGMGVLNKWKWPNIEGLRNFKGELYHSAQWNRNADLKGKRVALIGAGSSGVQILPNIYDQADHVYHWIRSKIWITAGFAQKFAGKDGANFIYSDEQKKLFEDSDAYLTYRKMIEGELNQRFGFIINGSEAQNEARAFSENEMKRGLKDKPELLEHVMPSDFFVACRRPTPGNGYLEALTGPKTTAYTQQLQRITETGFVDPDGNEHDVDVIICATGFDTTYKPRIPLLVNGVDKREEWTTKETVPSYLSLGYAGVPNYLIYAGAYCPSAHGSFLPLIAAYCDYTCQIIEKMQVENIKWLRPSEKATDHFLKHANTFLKRTAWTGPCVSWFKGGRIDGKPAIYPGSRLHFLKLLEKVRFEDYEIEYDDEDDMFAFLGNGFHACERDGSDITWYLGAPKKKVEEQDVIEVMDGMKGITLQKP